MVLSKRKHSFQYKASSSDTNSRLSSPTSSFSSPASGLCCEFPTVEVLKAMSTRSFLYITMLLGLVVLNLMEDHDYWDLVQQMLLFQGGCPSPTPHRKAQSLLFLPSFRNQSGPKNLRKQSSKSLAVKRLSESQEKVLFLDLNSPSHVCEPCLVAKIRVALADIHHNNTAAEANHRGKKSRKASGSSTTCVGEMFRYMDQLKSSWEEGVSWMLTSYPKDCQACEIENCFQPPLSSTSSREGSDPIKTLPPLSPLDATMVATRSNRLESVPHEYRLPSEAWGNLDRYLASHPSLFLRNGPSYAWEWNPSIVPIQPHQIPSGILARASTTAADLPVYLASYRVSKKNNCFAANDPALTSGARGRAPRTMVDDGPPWRDLMGLALLRADLTIITDAVFKIEHVMHSRDYRLFQLRSQLYLASFDRIVPLTLINHEDRVIVGTANAAHDLKNTSDTTDAPEGDHLLSNSDDRITVSHFFEGVVETKTPLFALSFPTEVSCCTSPSCIGKNFNYFVDAYNRTMVETYPMEPHQVETIDLTSRCRKGDESTWTQSQSFENHETPLPSFATKDLLDLPKYGGGTVPYTEDRGTACCVTIPDPRNKTKELLMGVSHFKIEESVHPPKMETPARQYLSRLYAFEPFPPYRLVARSGGFCMDLPSDEEVEDNPAHALAFRKPLLVLGQSFLCPSISFVSGISEHAHDRERLIMAYGINDCTNRLVQYNKSDLTRILFPQYYPPRPTRVS